MTRPPRVAAQGSLVRSKCQSKNGTERHLEVLARLPGFTSSQVSDFRRHSLTRTRTVPTHGRLARALVDGLRARQLSLVLDDCEHLIAVCADLAEELLRPAPALRILATSREALGWSGETVCRVSSLSVPTALASVSVDALAEAEASRLFIERAHAIDAAFTPTPDNADAIARICRRLDGIPLAIELAAARVVVLSPEQIEQRLQDRFRLLTGGARSAVARQRTLEATMDWSYKLLSDVERKMLIRLSVFPAAWTLAAAEHVCGGEGIDECDVLDLLSRLVGKSLVVADTESAGERRYRLLETVRQYASDRLVLAGAAERLRGRHFEFFFNEFRAALPVLFWFWTKRGVFEEGRHWLERAVALESSAVPQAIAWIRDRSR